MIILIYKQIKNLIILKKLLKEIILTLAKTLALKVYIYMMIKNALVDVWRILDIIDI